MLEGIAAAQARIDQIRSQFTSAADTAGGRLGESGGSQPTDPTGFADLLAKAQDPTSSGATASSGDVPAGGTDLNKAGVNSVQWAKDFLTRINMPVTSENVKAIVAWEKAEGTAARFNPLATTQGGFAGATKFNSVGVKNYVSYDDGIAANAKVIQNGLYPNILAALQKGTSAMDVAQAIKASPWGTGGLVEKIVASGG
jgi:ethanolamine ammonia-lyase large subunit